MRSRPWIIAAGSTPFCSRPRVTNWRPKWLNSSARSPRSGPARPPVEIFQLSSTCYAPQKRGICFLSLPRQRELQQQIALDEGKIVVRHQRNDGLIACVTVHRDAFHVVDLVGEIGLDQRSAVAQRVRLNAGEGNSADANGETACERKSALEQQQV